MGAAFDLQWPYPTAGKETGNSGWRYTTERRCGPDGERMRKKKEKIKKKIINC